MTTFLLLFVAATLPEIVSIDTVHFVLRLLLLLLLLVLLFQTILRFFAVPLPISSRS